MWPSGRYVRLFTIAQAQSRPKLYGIAGCPLLGFEYNIMEIQSGHSELSVIISQVSATEGCLLSGVPL